MAQTIAEMNIYQKLSGMRRMVDVLRKNKSGFNYKYVDENEILSRVKAGMDKYHVMLTLETVHGTFVVTPYSYIKTKNLKGGGQIEEKVNEVIVNADTIYTWINEDNPEDRHVVPWVAAGQQGDVSQAFGSGLTYFNRYFFLKFFQVATPDDDPDNWKSKKRRAEQEEESELVAQIVEEVQELISSYLNTIKDDAKLQDARAELSTVIKKHAKDSKGKPSPDYRNITNPKIASALLDDLKKMTGGYENA